jgi:hypothetical protein
MKYFEELAKNEDKERFVNRMASEKKDTKITRDKSILTQEKHKLSTAILNNDKLKVFSSSYLAKKNKFKRSKVNCKSMVDQLRLRKMNQLDSFRILEELHKAK